METLYIVTDEKGEKTAYFDKAIAKVAAEKVNGSLEVIPVNPSNSIETQKKRLEILEKYYECDVPSLSDEQEEFLEKNMVLSESSAQECIDNFDFKNAVKYAGMCNFRYGVQEAVIDEDRLISDAINILRILSLENNTSSYQLGRLIGFKQVYNEDGETYTVYKLLFFMCMGESTVE